MDKTSIAQDMARHAVIYCRVSTQDQADHGTSLESQEAACRKYAEAQGYTVVEVIRESRSGATLNRPGLDKARELVQAGVAQAVIFYALDRLSRDDTDTLILAREFRARGAELKCATTSLEETPQGHLLLSVLAALGKMERAGILERTMRGKRQTARNGTILRPPISIYGYEYRAGSYHLVESEAHWVQRVFYWYLQDGLSLKAIAYRLDEQNVPTRAGGRWAPTTVRNMLLQDAYYGEYWWGKQEAIRGKQKRNRPRSEWVGPISVPAIITREEHEGALQRLQYNKVYSARNCRLEYLLRGLVFCPVCGRRYGGQKVTKKGGIETYYRCSKQNKAVRGEDCDGPRVNGQRAEEAAWKWVIKKLSDPNLIQSIMEGEGSDEGAEAEKGQRVRDEADLKALLQERATLDQDENMQIDLYSKGAISFDKFMERKAHRDERATGIEASIREIEERQASRVRTQEEVKAAIDIVGQVQRGLPRLRGTLSFAEKRAVLEALHVKCTAVEGGDVFVTGYISQDLLRLAPTEAEDSTENDVLSKASLEVLYTKRAIREQLPSVSMAFSAELRLS